MTCIGMMECSYIFCSFVCSMFVFYFILLAMVLSGCRLNDICLHLWYLRIPFDNFFKLIIALFNKKRKIIYPFVLQQQYSIVIITANTSNPTAVSHIWFGGLSINSISSTSFVDSLLSCEKGYYFFFH